MTELRDNIFAIECPQTLAALNLYGNEKGVSEVRALDWKIVNGSPKTKQWNYFLPVGRWDIICQSNSADEYNATRIVERRELAGEGNYSYVNYDFENDRVAFFLTAIESMESLLKSKGLTAGNYLIVKRFKDE